MVFFEKSEPAPACLAIEKANNTLIWIYIPWFLL